MSERENKTHDLRKIKIKTSPPNIYISLTCIYLFFAK